MRTSDIRAFKSAIQYHLSNARQSAGLLFAFFLMFALLAGQHFGLQQVKSSAQNSPVSAQFQQNLAPVLLQETFLSARTDQADRDRDLTDPVEDLYDYLTLIHPLRQPHLPTTGPLTSTYSPDRRNSVFLSTLVARAPPLFI
ncbi:hypothetical protein [Nitrincola sp. MINF-07-Sa-05]|uniref:hypothetical protein n=1 Tax=Nitrincola salilacus TaxID=3400273 RepID=UPI00391855E5